MRRNVTSSSSLGSSRTSGAALTRPTRVTELTVSEAVGACAFRCAMAELFRRHWPRAACSRRVWTTFPTEESDVGVLFQGPSGCLPHTALPSILGDVAAGESLSRWTSTRDALSHRDL